MVVRFGSHALMHSDAQVTFNDMLFSAFGGAIRRYCEARNDPLLKSGAAIQLRALLPVAFPRSQVGLLPLICDWLVSSLLSLSCVLPPSKPVRFID